MAYARSQKALHVAKVLIGAWVWVYGLLAFIGWMTPGVGAGAFSQSTLAFTIVTTIPVGCAWVFGGWPSRQASVAFVLYADIVVAAVLISLGNPSVVLPCAALFTVIGSYIAGFHGSGLFVLHQVVSLATAGLLYGKAFVAVPEERWQISAYLVILFLVMFSAPLIMQMFVMTLRRDVSGAFFDPLTGLRNRRGFDAAIMSLQDRHGPTVQLTALVVDLDNFKFVNDRYGHEHGDVAIRLTATRIAEVFTAPAVTARLGGEEFAAVIVGHPESAGNRAEHLRKYLNNIDDRCPLTASIGVASGQVEIRDDLGAVGDLLARADQAMYDAKQLGGDRVAWRSEPADPGPPR